MSGPSRLVLAVISFAATAALASCSASEPEPEATVAAPEPTVAVEEPVDKTDDEPEPIPNPTCEGLLSASVVSDFEGLNWTPREEPLRVGERIVDGGIICYWADYDGPGTDNIQAYGWAPLGEHTDGELQRTLAVEGWIREEGPEGTYLTEDPSMALQTDADGYGMTYLFTDTAILVSDTKQGLVLIEWPPAG